MLLISCPWCGPRNDVEFTPGGEAYIARPDRPAAVSDAAWGEYQYFRSNVKGVQTERWFHAYGCRRWFHAVRDTVTHEVRATYAMGQSAPPELLP